MLPHITLGEFRFNNEFICHSFELPWLNNLTSVSCIPFGEYEIRKRWSPSFNRSLYEVCDVPGRTHILIHAANRPKELRGCIAPFTAFDVAQEQFFAKMSGKALHKLEQVIANERLFTVVVLPEDNEPHCEQ